MVAVIDDGGSHPADRPRITVLFVDDEDAVLRSISRILARTDLDVLTTTHPADALEQLAATRVDVIVSDIDMPEMNGLQLLERVRREHPRVLRMLLTGAATVDRALHAINEGEVVRFFRKPFDVEVFRRSMSALAHRIESMRAEGAEVERRRRAAALQGWVTSRFPDLLDDVGEPGFPVEIDAGRLAEVLRASSDPQLRDLVTTEIASTPESSR